MKTLFMFIALFVQLSSCGVIFGDVIYVSKDGSANYSTIGAAIAAAPEKSKSRIIIKIKPGIYQENIIIPEKKTMITLVGYGMDNTIITADRSMVGGFNTEQSATAYILGDGFAAINLTFKNTAGPSNGQAVAFKNIAKSSFYMCRFMGYQDTLYAKHNQQFYRECEIYGTVDMIFGDASAIFQNCVIIVRKTTPNKVNTITAQGRDNPMSDGGYVFQNCIFKAAADLPPTSKTYLGRPWRSFARVVVMKSEIGKFINPLGWVRWNKTSPVDKLYYAEYENRGLGADTSKRVDWPGRKLLNRAEASIFTVNNFIQGQNWIPSEIPYDLGL